MSTSKKSLVWLLRATGVASLAFALAVSGFTPAFAEEGEAPAPEESAPEESAPEESAPEESAPEESAPEESAPEESAPEESAPEESAPEESAPEESAPEESAPEESAPEESAPEESAPEGGYILNGEAITPDEHGYVPPPEAFEGLGGWAEVDDITGAVRTVVVGDYSSAAMWEHAKRTMAGRGTSMRFQSRATPDGNVAGWNNATFEKSSGTFRVDSGANSFSVVPEKTSRNADGTGRSYNIGSGIVDIKTDNTFSSGDASANVRTYRSDYQDETLDVSVTFPNLGFTDPERTETVFSYALKFRTDESSERLPALDRLSIEVDSVLLDNGYVATATSVDEETGEETSTETIDSENSLVVAVREVTRSVVEFLSNRLGFGRD